MHTLMASYLPLIKVCRAHKKTINYQVGNDISGADSRGFVGFSRTPPPRLKMLFSLEILDTVDKFELPYLPKYPHPLTLYLILLLNKSISLPMNVCKIAR